MLPNFLVIGAMKTGTSSLYRYVRDHPQIFITRPKELRFFGSNWDRGPDWYEQLFDGAENAVAIGEASTEYSFYPYFPDVAARIASAGHTPNLCRTPPDRTDGVGVSRESDPGVGGRSLVRPGGAGESRHRLQESVRIAGGAVSRALPARPFADHKVSMIG